eukprot:s1458_g2.t1
MVRNDHSSEEDALLPDEPGTVHDLQQFGVSGQWPKSPASTGEEADMDSQVPEEERSLLPHGSQDSQKSVQEAEMDHQGCGIEITLNVYDASRWEIVQWFNTLFAYQNAPIKLGGIFHVGVQVGDEEWAFGATLSGSGVCRHKPRGAEMHHFRESIPMGTTTLSKRELDKQERGRAKATTSFRTTASTSVTRSSTDCESATSQCGRTDLPTFSQRPARQSASWIRRRCDPNICDAHGLTQWHRPSPATTGPSSQSCSMPAEKFLRPGKCGTLAAVRVLLEAFGSSCSVCAEQAAGCKLLCCRSIGIVPINTNFLCGVLAGGGTHERSHLELGGAC